jgi:UDPglucose--hexose-1-phosphate uridylyltransferase
LTGEYLLVSPQRTERPWQGRRERPPADRRPAYDPGCHLCPGSPRTGGHQNLRYTGTFVFDNDLAALLPGDAAPPAVTGQGFFTAEPETHYKQAR